MNLGDIRASILENSIPSLVLRYLPDALVSGFHGRRIKKLHTLHHRGQNESLEFHLQNELAAMLRSALRHVPHYRDTIPIHPKEVTGSNARAALT